jgi:Sigma-70 region 2
LIADDTKSSFPVPWRGKVSQPLGDDDAERRCALPGSETALMPSKNPDDDTSITLMMRLGQSPADDEAWDRFVERYQPMIRAWCLRRGSQASDADDVAQEVLTKLVTARGWVGRVDLGGRPPRPSTDPDVPVKGIQRRRGHPNTHLRPARWASKLGGPSLCRSL